MEIYYPRPSSNIFNFKNVHSLRKCVLFRVVETMKIFRKLQEICVRVCECMFESVLLTITGFQLNSMISQNLNTFQNNVPLYSIPAFYIIVLEIIRRNNIYSFKVSIRNTWKRWEICSKLTIKTPERRQLRLSGIFIVNFELFYTFF